MRFAGENVTLSINGREVAVCDLKVATCQTSTPPGLVGAPLPTLEIPWFGVSERRAVDELEELAGP